MEKLRFEPRESGSRVHIVYDQNIILRSILTGLWEDRTLLRPRKDLERWKSKQRAFLTRKLDQTNEWDCASILFELILLYLGKMFMEDIRVRNY